MKINVDLYSESTSSWFILLQTPILWSHGMADQTVLFGAGQAGPPFLEQAGMTCEFKVLPRYLFYQPWFFMLLPSLFSLYFQAYPNLGHSITPEELHTLESFIKKHLKSSSWIPPNHLFRISYTKHATLNNIVFSVARAENELLYVHAWRLHRTDVCLSEIVSLCLWWRDSSPVWLNLQNSFCASEKFPDVLIFV